MLVISASMGAGHDGAARELADRLASAGHHAEVRDFLDSGPLRLGAVLRSGYEFELKHVPSAYEATYRLWYRAPWLCPVVAWLVTALAGRRVLRWIRDSGAAVVVSTYPAGHPLSGPAAGDPPTRHSDRQLHHRLRGPPPVGASRRRREPRRPRRAGGDGGPPHRTPGGGLRARRGRRLRTRRPALRDLARQALGLDAAERAVLVVAGSWGVGGLQATWRALTADRRFTPVVVCGRDERLRQEVTALAAGAPGNSVVIGWTDQMPALMAACDALVENAGGLTSLEAMRAGLPVVSFQPIAGHGRENTARMAEAGVSRLAGDATELSQALEELTSTGTGTHRPGTGRTGHVPRQRRPPDPRGRPGPAGPAAPPARRVRWAEPSPQSSVAAGLAWTGLTTGVDVAAASVGAGVAHPGDGADMVAYVGVRLNAPELADRTIAAELQRMHFTAVVDSATALSEPHGGPRPGGHGRRRGQRRARRPPGVGRPRRRSHAVDPGPQRCRRGPAARAADRRTGDGRRSRPAGQRVGSDRVRQGAQLAGHPRPRSRCG